MNPDYSKGETYYGLEEADEAEIFNAEPGPDPDAPNGGY